MVNSQVVFIGYKPTTIWEYDGDLMIYLGKFDHDLTVRPYPGIIINKGNHPQPWPNYSG